MTWTLSDAVEQVEGDEARRFLAALREDAAWESRFSVEAHARQEPDGVLVFLRVSCPAPALVIATIGVRFVAGGLRADRIDDETLRFPRRRTGIAMSAQGTAQELGARAVRWFQEALRELDGAREQTRTINGGLQVITRLGDPWSRGSGRWDRTVLAWPGGTDAWLLKRGRRGRADRIVHLRGWRVRRHHWPKGFSIADMAAAAFCVLVVLVGLIPPVLIVRMVYHEVEGHFSGVGLLPTLGVLRSLWLVVAGACLAKAVEAAVWGVIMKEGTLLYVLRYLYLCDAVLGIGWLVFYQL